MKQLFTIFCIVAASTVYGQKVSSSFYANVGLTASKYMGDDVSSSDFTYQLHGGLMSDTRLSDKLRFFVAGQYGNLGDDDLKVRYVSIPFALGYAITDKLSGYAGMSVQVFGKVNQQNGFTAGELESLFNNVTGGIFTQVSYDLGDKFYSYINYTHGVGNALKDTAAGEIDAQDQILRIGVGFKLIGD